MSLNHNVQSSPKENYMNGYISDFTDCIDFTKQYQKSCGFDEESSEALSDIQIPVKEKEENINGENNLNYNLDDKQEQNEVDNINNKKYSLKLDAPICPTDSSKNFPPNETEYQPIEPDVSITIGETNLDKSNNHIAPLTSIKNNLEKFLSIEGNKNLKKKTSKQKLVKKNHSKLPVNKNIKKKVALLKFKNGKFTKKKSDSLQFQGIQSNIKFKCYKCSYSDLSSFSELQSHQRKCTSGIADTQSVNETGSSHTNQSPSNFRITRKVYLCSACGSYYENWNLFLHMKEMHKRHICLYCLGMFSHPDKLSQHLQAKHNVIEQTFSHIDEFSKLYRGTCYLICVTCEAMFSEQEDFIEHSCVSHTEDLSSCPLCGLQGAHFPTCRRAFSDRFTEPEAQKSHPALGKKLSIKKKRVKSAKKAKEMFQIVSNDGSGEMSMIVRKQNLNDVSQSVNDSNNKENPSVMDNSVMSSIVNSSDDLTKHYNEKMLQLYKPNKSSEKVISSIQSIEDSINRVVENLRLTDNCEYEKEEEDESECYEADGEANSEDHRTVSQQVLVKENVSSPVDQFPPSSEHGLSDNFLPGEEKEIPESEEEQSILANNKQEEDLSNEINFKSKPDVNPNLSECESTDSEKLTIAFDHPSEQCSEKVNEMNAKGNSASKQEDNIPTASTDISYIFVSLKDEPVDLKSLIKEFVKVSCWNCVYCSHAKRIALNGKQLALHILAEHRFVTVPESSSEEEKEKSALDIINRLKSNFSTLESVYFNTDTFDSEDKDFWKMNDRIYECFHCLFATYVHKELCSHNRKMHQKAMFLCIMCKSNFYTYSELLCHLCPGIYVSGQVINPDITYRCFLCDVEPLPSSFRLMVHLRRKHNSCDICFDQSSNQFQLSTHVWKHKLSHMCYRCGIAYRNKPDITKHLFWKHGTESVLCKKCLQKKWPHVYHFCVPPNSFVCDECSISLKSAVALKVHKRLHAGDYPHLCTKCDEKFISRKLLVKHLEKHEEKIEKVTETETETEAEPGPPEIESENNNIHKSEVKSVDVETNCTEDAENKPEKEKKSKKKKVINDVFDLPPVNLSESDDSDQEDSQAPKVFKSESPTEESSSIPNGCTNSGIQNNEPSPTQIVDGVWNNFQNYLVAKDMPKTFKPPSPFRKMTLSRIKEIMLSDHDYHIIPNSMPQEGNQPSTTEGEIPLEGHKNKKVGLDHDYCNNVQKGKANCKSKQKTKHKENGSKSSSSDSSSDSDSSCSCGSNCSCSSGSSSSSSSNDSDSDSREKRKQKKVVKDPKESNEGVVEIPADVDISVHDVSNENLIRESDLDTDETETDEDFYDYNPAREANRILAEKRTQLLANLNGSETVMSSSVIGSEKPATPKKKTKMKKKRSQLRSNAASKGNRKKGGTSGIPLSKNRIQTFQAESGLAGDGNCNASHDASSNQVYGRGATENSAQSPGDVDTKRPKRKRVPLKFYGFSSDDEGEATPAVKKRDKNEVNTTIPADTTPTTSSGFEVAGDATPTAWNPHSRSSLSWKIEKCDASTPKVNPIKIRTSQAGGKSTPTVENNVGAEYFPPKRPFQVNGNPVANKGEKLYCFCQCPYDEVSEMIACDAEDCYIEWFHFECVGIMVPPKGSWYCPDCRKKLAAENEFMCPPANERS